MSAKSKSIQSNPSPNSDDSELVYPSYPSSGHKGYTSNQFRLVETYDRLERFYQAWAEGEIQNLCIVGPGGRGKTHGYEKLKLEHHLFRGRTSAITMYRTVMESPDLPIVFDDIRALLKDGNCLDLMKQFCDSRKARRIRWNTAALDEDERMFTCTSPVLVILNWIPKDDSDVAAIIDRFDCLFFNPTKSEILNRMRLFAKSQADVDRFARMPIDPSLRDLIRFEAWKESKHIDEMEELMATCGIPKDIQQMVQILESDPQPKNKIEAFARLSGKSLNTAKVFWTRNKAKAERLVCK